MSQNPLMIKNSKLYLQHFDKATLNKIASHLTLPNPLYHKLQRMGNARALYAVPKNFHYFESLNYGDLLVPRGVEDNIKEYCKNAHIPLEIIDNTVVPPMEIPLKTNIKLRDYQYGIIEKINPKENQQGVLKADTGWGKSVLALKLAEACQTRTLIIVPRLHLLESYVRDCRRFASREANIIQGSRRELGDLTVATSQTLSRVIRSNEVTRKGLEDYFGLIIFDECHGAVSKRNREVAEFFRGRFRYGLSATPRRTDEQSKAINFIFGPQLIDEALEKGKPTVQIIKSLSHIPMSHEYARIIESQMYDQQRNTLIQDTIMGEIRTGRRVLCLTKRISHYREIGRGLVERGTKVTFIDSSTPKKKLADKIMALREGTEDFDLLLGTFSMCATGLDIPSISTVVLAGDIKSNVLQEQAMGRALRIFAGKPSAHIIDIVDVNNPILYRQAKARENFYRELGWDLTIS